MDFGQNITYQCETDHLFEFDPHVVDFNLTCLQDGTWSNHSSLQEWNGCVHPDLRYCIDPPSPPTKGLTTFTPSQSGLMSYGSQVTYTCELGSIFRDLHTFELYKERILICQWNKTWIPSEIDLCVPTRCMDPYTLPNMVHDFDYSQGVLLDEYLRYKCLAGYYFEDDRDQVDLAVKCVKGHFEWPSNWTNCVNEVNCTSPTEKPEGGTRHWNRKLNYGTKVAYTCGPHAQFKLENNEIVDEIVSVCEWNKTWSVENLSPCIFTECIVPPQRPTGTGNIHFYLYLFSFEQNVLNKSY